MKNITAIYPGTFDPITFGHLEIIKRGAKIFNHIIIAVAEDTNKSPLFSVEERVAMAKGEVAKLKSTTTKIEVSPFSGLLVDFASKSNATVVIRGLRAVSDFEYEFQMAYMNQKINSKVETLFIPANEASNFISSRFVKEMARLGGKIEGFVSQEIAQKLYETRK
ncbi:MAG: pantetheine-phosphate adenylyltransferase [Candidatus Midichloriaceae bacterium]|jgi:pantetheine-phosphate adenylyltransferase|nr:pantetheine-phosphate adenylyltransferase [Candidatus Midichloriaceae bacterium]